MKSAVYGISNSWKTEHPTKMLFFFLHFFIWIYLNNTWYNISSGNDNGSGSCKALLLYNITSFFCFVSPSAPIKYRQTSTFWSVFQFASDNGAPWHHQLVMWHLCMWKDWLLISIVNEVKGTTIRLKHLPVTLITANYDGLDYNRLRVWTFQSIFCVY